jgi:hypothetical protein
MTVLEPKVLTEAVLREWKKKDEEKLPIVIEEPLRNTDALQVYVVWSEWLDVDEEHRTAAILDAYEKNFGATKARQIIVALGVLPQEAKELGIIE